MTISFAITSFLPQTVVAKSLEKIAVVYMTEDHSPSIQSTFWEAQFSGFANDVTMISVQDVQALEIYDAVLFIGEVEGVVPETFQKSLKTYQGQFIALGYNAEQLPMFANWNFGNEEVMREIDGEFLPFPAAVRHVLPPDESEILGTATILEGEIPFIVKNGRISYVAATSIGQQEVFAVSKHIPELLGEKGTQTHKGYLVLNQISPFMEVDTLEATAKTILAAEIPLYISIKPAIFNRVTGEELRLVEDKRMLKLLKELQDQGAYIIVEGYNQVYRTYDVKSDLEFWDSLYDQPITKDDVFQEGALRRKEATFSSQSAYETVRLQELEQETNYIYRKLTSAIDELIAAELYPIAFKVPGDAMSGNGYQITSEYFTSLFGGFQLSDETQFSSSVPLFISQPSKLNGLTLYPYTLPSIDGNSENPLAEAEQMILQLQEIPGATIGGSVSANVDVEELQTLIHMMKEVEGLQWLDLKDYLPVVETESYKIVQQPEGTLQYTSKVSKRSQLWNAVKERPFEASLWVMAIIVLLFIIGFFINISTLRIRLRKRLFEEREQNG